MPQRTKAVTASCLGHERVSERGVAPAVEPEPCPGPTGSASGSASVAPDHREHRGRRQRSGGEAPLGAPPPPRARGTAASRSGTSGQAPSRRTGGSTSCCRAGMRRTRRARASPRAGQSHAGARSGRRRPPPRVASSTSRPLSDARSSPADRRFGSVSPNSPSSLAPTTSCPSLRGRSPRSRTRGRAGFRTPTC